MSGARVSTVVGTHHMYGYGVEQARWFAPSMAWIVTHAWLRAILLVSQISRSNETLCWKVGRSLPVLTPWTPLNVVALSPGQCASLVPAGFRRVSFMFLTSVNHTESTPCSY